MSNANKYDAAVDICGDIIGVYWTGSVWQCPSTGSQHARKWDALAVEVVQYLQSCGETEHDGIDLAEFDSIDCREYFDLV